MELFISIVIGYLLGCISPSALIAKIKKKNLKEEGTGNLGASNVTLVFGKLYGLAVMLFDIAKGFAAFRLAAWLFPAFPLAGLFAGTAAVVGHMFPFYLKFKGGKGLAAFGGLILAYDWRMFLMVLFVGVGLMFIVNHTFILPYSAAILFCVLATLSTKSLAVFLITLWLCALLLLRHIGNVEKAIHGKDMKVRDVIGKRKGRQENSPME